MTNTPILSLPQVATNQNQKEATINSSLAILEAAMNDAVSISLSSGDRTLTTDEFTKFFHQKYSGQTAGRQVTIPATVRWFAVSNLGTFTVTIKANGSSGATASISPSTRALVLSDGVDVVLVSEGVNTLADLTDTTGLDSASTGQAIQWDGSAWSAADVPMDIRFYGIGMPGAGAKVYRTQFTRNAIFLADFSGSFASADALATSSAVFTIKKNGVAKGTVTFAALSRTGVFSTDVGSGSVTLSISPGDVIEVTAPSSQDASLSDWSIVLKGTYL